ncbi:MAG TPA: hypothetical protein VNF74_06210 [Terriglobales bacterium]|nr:hypothetical protein [Terriglobales bacterium]
MATRTQVQIDVVPECIHEQICQSIYEQQRRRIQVLCQWMAPDEAQARQLALRVFVDAWRQPSQQAWPAVSSDRLAESFAAHFRDLFPAHALLGVAAPERGLPLRAAVTALPSAHRLLYLMHELEGYSAETLAAWLDLEPSQCARMIHEARLQLRRRLLAAGEGPLQLE